MERFVTSVEWLGGERLTTRTQGGLELPVSSPVQFGGEPGRWTPEEMLVGGVESCILLTALYFIQRRKIGLKSWTSRAEGTVEKTPNGLRFTRIQVRITARVATEDDVPRLREAVELAEKYCPLSAAVNFPVEFSLDVAKQ